MKPVNLTIDMLAFIERWQFFNSIKSPDPILNALQSLYKDNNLAQISPQAREKCLELIGFWQRNAVPGRVLLALKSREYVNQLSNWRPGPNARAN